MEWYNSLLILPALLGVGFIFRDYIAPRASRRGDPKSSLGADTSVAQKEIAKRIYELAILKEIGEQVGTSLNVQNMTDVVLASLNRFLRYKLVAYMLLEPKKIVFKVNIPETVSHKFLSDVKGRMLGSLSALHAKGLEHYDIEEIISGVVFESDTPELVNSYFNIPIIVSERVVGVLTVADSEPGLYTGEEVTILYKIIKQASESVSRLRHVVDTEQRKLGDMIHGMSEGIIMTDKEYHIIAANPVAYTIAGLDTLRQEPTLFDFAHGLGDSFNLTEKLEESLKNNKELTLASLPIKDKIYEVTISPVKDSSPLYGKEMPLLGGVIVFHDITKEKEIEELRDNFTSMIVHDLRSPLGVIRYMIDLTKKDIADDGKVDDPRTLDMMYASATSMLDQVNSILDNAKLESGEFELLKKEESITDIIDDRITYYAPLFASKQITASEVYNPALPKLSVDKQALMRVFNNLISNALKYTQTGGTISVGVFVHSEGIPLKEEIDTHRTPWVSPEDIDLGRDLKAGLVVAVSDNGAGIPDAERSGLFQKFKQLHDSTNANTLGTGLGLVVVKGIIEAHGGVVGYTSREGVGSTFYFYIPRA